MTIYDLSNYIALRHDIKPGRLYIHQGVAKGARTLSLIADHIKETVIELTEIWKKYPELKKLGSADHLENFLCIWHKQLKKLKL